LLCLIECLSHHLLFDLLLLYILLINLFNFKNKCEVKTRFIIGNETVWISELLEILEEKYSKYGYKFPKKNASNFL